MKLSSLYRFYIPAMLFLLSPAVSFAWIDTGHEIIASIAYDELTPATRAAVNALLKQHPRYQKDLLDGLPTGFDLDRYAFMKAATWPDMVRGQTHPMHFVADHPFWHFIDLPIAAPGDDIPATQSTTQPSTLSAATTQPADPQNILEALDKAARDVRDEKLSPAHRAIALCWLTHLCGDIHQPLHVSNFYSSQYPQGDKGGNLAKVRRPPSQFSAIIDLHALWDEMLGLYQDPNMIEYVASSLRRDPQYSRDKFKAELCEQSFAAWADGTHKLALPWCYLNGDLATLKASATRGDLRQLPPYLPPDYLANAEKVAARQAVLAGYRLADLLNRVLRG
jgi:hypothetical protein